MLTVPSPLDGGWPWPPLQLKATFMVVALMRCTFCVQPSCCGTVSLSACSWVTQTFTVWPLGPMPTPCWAIICSICLRCAGGMLARDFCISAMAASICPLWLFIVMLCSHSPGRIFCGWAWARPMALGSSTAVVTAMANRCMARLSGRVGEKPTVSPS